MEGSEVLVNIYLRTLETCSNLILPSFVTNMNMPEVRPIQCQPSQRLGNLINKTFKWSSELASSSLSRVFHANSIERNSLHLHFTTSSSSNTATVQLYLVLWLLKQLKTHLHWLVKEWAIWSWKQFPWLCWIIPTSKI